MKRKITPTIMERAIIEVPDFENVIKKLSEQVDLRGQSKSLDKCIGFISTGTPRRVLQGAQRPIYWGSFYS